MKNKEGAFSYQEMVAIYDRLLQGKTLPLFYETSALPKRNLPSKQATGLQVMICSPHPDDESIIGGLPLRLMNEGATVTNVAVTLGSNQARRAARREELRLACGYLGFSLSILAGEGLVEVNLQSRTDQPARWQTYIELLQKKILTLRPDVIICPHSEDGHPTHQGTHALVMDTIAVLNYDGWVVQSEFWQPMKKPNLMIASCSQDVTDLMVALACHVGEVERNPYHLRLPAWMADNVRRGGEIMYGHIGCSPPYSFATLYRAEKWQGNSLQENEIIARVGPGEAATPIFKAN